MKVELNNGSFLLKNTLNTYYNEFYLHLSSIVGVALLPCGSTFLPHTIAISLQPNKLATPLNKTHKTDLKYFGGRCSTKYHRTIVRTTDQVVRKPSKNASIPCATQKKQAIQICIASITENGRYKLIRVSTVFRLLELVSWCRKLQNKLSDYLPHIFSLQFYLTSTPCARMNISSTWNVNICIKDLYKKL